jgi:hypothetical protein
MFHGSAGEAARSAGKQEPGKIESLRTVLCQMAFISSRVAAPAKMEFLLILPGIAVVEMLTIC